MLSRRKFIIYAGRGIGALALGSIATRVLRGTSKDAEFTQPNHGYGWKIDSSKCTFCGKCETACVRTPSAVKAVNDLRKCSNCMACYGHTPDKHLSSDKIDSEGKRICPHDAVTRTPLGAAISEGAFLYTIQPERCTGCAQCAHHCNTEGTGSMFMIIRPDLCLGCNECSIARVCPSKAIERVPSYPVNDYKGEYELDYPNGAASANPS